MNIVYGPTPDMSTMSNFPPSEYEPFKATEHLRVMVVLSLARLQTKYIQPFIAIARPYDY